MRYIDADLIQYEPMLRPQGNGNYENCEIAYRDEIENLPTADVRENVKGEWINMERIEDDKAEYITEWQQAQCSVCHKWHTTPYMYFFTHYNFCPNCGADMRPITALSKNAEIDSNLKRGEHLKNTK